MLHVQVTCHCHSKFTTKIEAFSFMRFASFFVFSHDQLALIVDRIVSEADKDNDGCINFEEYKKAIDKLDIEEKMAFIGFK